MKTLRIQIVESKGKSQTFSFSLDDKPWMEARMDSSKLHFVHEGRNWTIQRNVWSTKVGLYDDRALKGEIRLKSFWKTDQIVEIDQRKWLLETFSRPYYTAILSHEDRLLPLISLKNTLDPKTRKLVTEYTVDENVLTNPRGVFLVFLFFFSTWHNAKSDSSHPHIPTSFD